MPYFSLTSFRERKGWNQGELAHRLGVSQTLVSLWESGVRPLPHSRLAALRKLGFHPQAGELPLRRHSHTMDFGQELANLGYPGYAHRMRPAQWNPAQFLVLALSQNDLDRRTAEGLPWVALEYSSMDWEWVRRECKLRDLQNRLGLTLTLARELAERKGLTAVAEHLENQESLLRNSLLAKQDTYCNESMTKAEREWLQQNGSSEALTWHVLSDLTPERLTHA